MIGKLICFADTREKCIKKMIRALDEIIIEGVDTNIEFQKSLINCESFKEDLHYTKFIESEFIEDKSVCIGG